MKQILLFMLLVALFVACNDATHDDDPIIPTSTRLKVKDKPDTWLVFKGKVGSDFDTALDSLIKKYEPMLNTLEKYGHYSGEGYNIIKLKVRLESDYDREFINVIVTEKANIYQILISEDVIDEEGNCYFLDLPED